MGGGEKTALVLQDRLEHILSLEFASCPENMLQTLCQESAILWADTTGAEDYLFLIQAAQIYSFCETEVKGGPGGKLVKKWEVTQIPDENGVLPERAKSWKGFCLNHLRISPPKATSLKRTWEIYRVQMDYSFGKLRLAGRSKLGVAVGTVASLLPGQHEGLMDALFGNEYKCTFCGRVIDFGQTPPLACPHCGAEWTPVAPSTLAQVILIINQIKALQKELANESEPDTKPVVEGGWYCDEEVREVTWIGFLVQGDQRTPLPAWRISLFEDDVIIPSDEMGIHVSELTTLQEAMSRGLKQE